MEFSSSSLFLFLGALFIAHVGVASCAPLSSQPPLASSSRLYMFNSSNTYGYGYKNYALSVDVADDQVKDFVVLQNVFEPNFQANSAATICGDYYIVIQVDAPLATGISIASISSNETYEYETPFLFHTVACDSSNSNYVFAIIDDPSGQNPMLFSVIHFNWMERTVEAIFGNYTYTSDGAILDSRFTFDPSCSMAWIFAPLSSSGNGGSLSILEIASGKWAQFEVEDYTPYQAFSIDSSGATGISYKTNVAGEVVGLYYGSWSLSNGKCAFQVLGEFSDIGKAWMVGLPYAYCSDRLYSVSQDGQSDGQYLSIYELPSLKALVVVPLADGRKVQQRSIAGIAIDC